MRFGDVIGQSAVKEQLAGMVTHNRLSHALLFLGREGSGALPLALAFAQYIVCEARRAAAAPAGPDLFGAASPEPSPEPRPATDACGTCPSCQKAAGLVHPDIHFTYPVVPKKAGTPPVSTDYISEWRDFVRTFPYGNAYDWLQAIGAENKQGNITAQECNDILRKLNLKSFESGYKILILWMPEYLGKEGNKLLKLIEEPPADTLFVLVAENESSILTTILSRCQLVKVPAIEPEALAQALVARNNTPPAQAGITARIAEGNYREALHLLQHSDQDFYQLLRDWLNATLKNQPLAYAKPIEEISRMGRENQKQFLRYFTHLLEGAVRLRALAAAGREEEVLSLFSESEREFVPRLNRVCTLEQLEAIGDELDKAAYYIERNAHSKILFHALTIKIFQIVKNNRVLTA